MDIEPKQICPLVSWHGQQYRLNKPLGNDRVQLVSLDGLQFVEVPEGEIEPVREDNEKE